MSRALCGGARRSASLPPRGADDSVGLDGLFDDFAKTRGRGPRPDPSTNMPVTHASGAVRAFNRGTLTDPAKRERAALDVLRLLPEWWAVGPTSYDPGTGRWIYTARGPHPGRGKAPDTVRGTGEDELAAMIDLRIRLDERRRVEKQRSAWP